MLTDTGSAKYLFVAADKYPPFRVDVTKLFGGEMVARGHVIDWVLQAEEDCAHSYQTNWAGCRVWVGKTDNGMSRWSRLRKHLFSICHDLIVFRLLKTERYDFVQVKDKYIAALFALIAARRHGVKFVFWSSYPFPEASIYEAKVGTARYPVFWFIRGLILQFILYRIITRAAHHIFVQSEQMKRDFIHKGVAEHKLTSVPMGFTPADFDSQRQTKALNLPDMSLSVLYLGTLIRARKLDFLVRAFAKVLDEIPAAKLYFVGAGEDPEDEALLKQEAENLAIAHAVFFTGFIPQMDAVNYVKNACVCVSPFYPTPILNSTSPTKLIEYMALGKAVVANDHPEQRLVLQESQGGICVAWQEEAFASALIQLLNNPDEAEKMGESGCRYVHQHRTYARIADKLESEYRRICG